ncbi:methyltransferase domain-containing protein [Streptomyces sp. NBC_01498]|uniref:methyltransferase domain-containing protein n=1 Tax=Streptomyces sp. NBC_01498 TaxID=2975870 RepID=UPI002E7C4ED5|nr:methyltransferase domain-containing protein [Streptomyces sp. NBC_01498]WTL26861.1 methyltransferase domain-containing protein [Streptomyces sp. NBC_01498]
MGVHREQHQVYGRGEEEAVAVEARAAMVRAMRDEGELADPAWRAAFEEVPRHLFVPYYFVSRPGGHDRLWCEDPDPVRRLSWLRGAYVDGALATRVRDGELISSSSQPSLMARMLAELDVRDGQNVLEIGAGTGYNAALLSHRVGDRRVTTVDLDPEITESARTHLATAGYRPSVVTGDGAVGCRARAPFDRIIATCTLPSVPSGWLEQCAPGARVLAPLATGLIALDVGEDAYGRYAEGRFLHTSAFFVPLRGGVSEPGPPAVVPRIGGLPRRALENDLFRFMLALTAGRMDPHETLSLWEREGRPQRERFGLTVGPDRQWAWLDDPSGPYVWPLSPGGFSFGGS